LENDSFNKRIKWTRIKLGLSLSDAAKGGGFDRSILFRWEKTTQPYKYSSLTSLIDYYDYLWSEKFAAHQPIYNARKVESITLSFLIIGRNDAFDILKVINEEVLIKLRAEMMEMALVNEGLKSEISRLGGDNG